MHPLYSVSAHHTESIDTRIYALLLYRSKACAIHTAPPTLDSADRFVEKSFWANTTPDRYNNLELTTYRNRAVSGKSDSHVDVSKYPRGKRKFSTWARNKTSEE